MDPYHNDDPLHEAMEAKDFLQDPDLWQDKLPQPYRLVDRIVTELVDEAWNEIEEREVCRQRAAAQVKIPTGPQGVVLCEKELVQVCGGVECGEGVIVVGNGESVCVVRCGLGEEDPGINGPEVDPEVVVCFSRETEVETVQILDQMDMKSKIMNLAVIKRSKLVVIVQLVTVVKILAFCRGVLTEISDISYQHKERPTDVIGISLSPTSSHIAVTFRSPITSLVAVETPETTNNMTLLGLYSLPVEAWSLALSNRINQPVNSSVLDKDTTSKSKATLQNAGRLAGMMSRNTMSPKDNNIFSQDVVFPKPLSLSVLSPPCTLTPCTALHPFITFQSIQDEKTQCLPSGELHGLTDLYFENRQRTFESKRKDFLSTGDVSTLSSEQHSLPHCHFLYYQQGQKLECPQEVAVWWEGSLQLAVYPFKETGSQGCPVASRRFPQTSPIVCSSSTKDTGIIVLALKSGVLVFWDMIKEFCSKIIPCVEPPDVVTTLKFFNMPIFKCQSLLGIGTEQGKVLAINASSLNNTQDSLFSLNARMQKQQEVYSGMFDSSGYDNKSKVLQFITSPYLPSLLTSLHADGSVLLWSTGEVACKLSLDNHFSLHSPPYCTFTSDGNYLLIAGEQKEGPSFLVCFDILSSPHLSTHWKEQTPTTPQLREATELQGEREHLETYLHKYTNSRYFEADDCLILWQKRWKELPNILTNKI